MYMKQILLLILLPINLIASDLTALQEKYNSAVSKAVEPINKVYVAELQKLLEKESKKGDLEEITKITGELKKFIIIADNKISSDVESFFVGKSWKTPSGTVFHFEENGQGFRQFGNDKTILIWKMTNNVVEVQSQTNEKGSIKKWYFKFFDKKTAKYGDAINVITFDLQLE